jgi:hypothetical protein
MHSAWAFMSAFSDDAVVLTYADEELSACVQDSSVPICIQEKQDRLFHEWKLDPGYRDWLKANFRRSTFLKSAERDPSYQNLLDKLHAAVGAPGPEHSLHTRLLKAKTVQQLVEIEEAHRQKVLANPSMTQFSKDELQLLRTLGHHVKLAWFQDASEPSARESSYGGSKSGAAFLAHSIADLLQKRGSKSEGFVEFSCHDQTLAALACHLGVTVPGYDWACYMLFELHDGDRVRIFYNPDPSNIPLKDLVCRVPDLEGAGFHAWMDLRRGDLRLTDFVRHCELNEAE